MQFICHCCACSLYAGELHAEWAASCCVGFFSGVLPAKHECVGACAVVAAALICYVCLQGRHEGSQRPYCFLPVPGAHWCG
jgi:hypothetical protein